MTAQSPHPDVAPEPGSAAARGWYRVWNALHSRFARHIAVATVAVGLFAGVGHFVGGLLGWWHLYEAVLHGKPKAAPGVKAQQFSFVVLPLEAEGDAGGAWFQDVLTADLTNELGRAPGSLVISRDTAATYAGRKLDSREIAKDLGVRYVVRGTAQRREDMVRIELALIDGQSGAQQWSQRFEFERARLAQGVEQMVGQITRTLSIEAYRAEGRRAGAQQLQDLEADDLAMQGWGVWFRGGLTREAVTESIKLFEAAVARDPRSLRGWGGVATMTATGRGLGFLPDRDAALRRVREAVDRLQALDEADPFTLLARAALHNQEGDWEATLAVADMLVERMPSLPQAHFTKGLMLMNLGRLEECVEPAKTALRIGPRDPTAALSQWQIATCHFMRGEYASAIEFGRLSWQTNRKLSLPPLVLAAALARTGQVEEARVLLGEHRQLFPDFRLEHVSERAMRASHPRYVEGRDRLVATLRGLGMP